MLSLPSSVRIYVASSPVDLRKGFYKLAALARAVVKEDPLNGHIFVFLNRRRNSAKALWWDRTGWLLLYKKLESGTFRLPTEPLLGQSHIEVDAGDEAAGLLSAIYRHPQLFRSRRNAERWIDLTERVSLIADLQEEPAFVAADLSRLDMPMLIMVGGLSNTLPSAREMARLCPQAIFHEVPDVGHFFPMTQPRLFLRPALRFLNAVNRGRVPINGRAVEERMGALPPNPRDI